MSTASLASGLEPCGNALLTALTPAVRQTIEAGAERVRLGAGDVVKRDGEPISHFYFIEDGMMVLVRKTEDGGYLEIATVGPEGIGPPAALLEPGGAALECIAAVPTTALRVAYPRMKELLAKGAGELYSLASSYATLSLEHIAETAACNMRHSVEQRCCRWLLTAHAAVRRSDFPLTHEFLSLVLGVRRASISFAAEALQRAGLIRYGRGLVSVLDPAQLSQRACTCYTTMRDQLDALCSNHRRRWKLGETQ